MRVCHSLDEFGTPADGVVLTIGNFDGVHRGHRAILDAARRHAGAAMPVVALTFDPHPLAILRPAQAPQPLTTLTERLGLLGNAGVDETIVLRSEPALLEMEAEVFLRLVAARLRPRTIIEGESFGFGRGRRGTCATLRAHADALGYALEIIPPTRAVELPGAPMISSSAIRAALQGGSVSVAAAMLERPYRITGVVGVGAGRGATLGFPTANIERIAQLVPGVGVYGGVVELAGGARYPSAINVGTQPTFGDSTYRVECHLLDFDGDLRGSAVGAYFVEHLRGQRAFPAVTALLEQIRSDVEQVRVSQSISAALRVPTILPPPGG